MPQCVSRQDVVEVFRAVMQVRGAAWGAWECVSGGGGTKCVGHRGREGVGVGAGKGVGRWSSCGGIQGSLRACISRPGSDGGT